MQRGFFLLPHEQCGPYPLWHLFGEMYGQVLKYIGKQLMFCHCASIQVNKMRCKVWKFSFKKFGRKKKLETNQTEKQLTNQKLHDNEMPQNRPLPILHYEHGRVLLLFLRCYFWDFKPLLDRESVDRSGERVKDIQQRSAGWSQTLAYCFAAIQHMVACSPTEPNRRHGHVLLSG